MINSEIVFEHQDFTTLKICWQCFQVIDCAVIIMTIVVLTWSLKTNLPLSFCQVCHHHQRIKEKNRPMSLLPTHVRSIFCKALTVKVSRLLRLIFNLKTSKIWLDGSQWILKSWWTYPESRPILCLAQKLFYCWAFIRVRFPCCKYHYSTNHNSNSYDMSWLIQVGAISRVVLSH